MDVHPSEWDNRVMSTATAYRHGYDRTGERLDDTGGPVTDEGRWTADNTLIRDAPKQCAKGRPFAADGSCCLYHDTHPA